MSHITNKEEDRNGNVDDNLRDIEKDLFKPLIKEPIVICLNNARMRQISPYKEDLEILISCLKRHRPMMKEFIVVKIYGSEIVACEIKLKDFMLYSKGWDMIKVLGRGDEDCGEVLETVFELRRDTIEHYIKLEGERLAANS